LKEINSDWEGKLMMTNYAPESLHGYLKTGLFKFKHDRLGKRFYLNVNLNKLVENRNINLGKKFGLKILNLVYQLVTKIKSGLLFKEHTLELAFAESSEYLGQNMQVTDSYFKRNHVEWNWIFKKSWLRIDENIENTNYPFSWKVKHFAYHFVSVKDEVNFVISNRNGIVKVLYWNEKNTSLTVMAKWLINYCYKNKVQTLTVIDNKLAQTIQQLRNPFVFSKPFSMNIYSTFDMNTGIGKFYDGDGDYIFT